MDLKNKKERERKIQFKENYTLQPSDFMNGCVCGHLHEIRCINFNHIIHNDENNAIAVKCNVPPVNVKLKRCY